MAGSKHPYHPYTNARERIRVRSSSEGCGLLGHPACSDRCGGVGEDVGILAFAREQAHRTRERAFCSLCAGASLADASDVLH